MKADRISKNYVARFMKRLARKLADKQIISLDRLNHASLNPFGFHSFRTTFETHMTNAGMNEKYIRFFMAHEQAGTGGKSYFKPTREQGEKVYLKFTEELQVNAKYATVADILTQGIGKLDSLEAIQHQQSELIQKLSQEVMELARELKTLKRE